MDTGRIIHGGDELPELQGGREVAEVLDGGSGLSLNEEHALSITVYLHEPVVVPAEACSHWVERDQGLAQSLLHHLGVEEIGDPAWRVEIHARRVEVWHHQIH